MSQLPAGAGDAALPNVSAAVDRRWLDVVAASRRDVAGYVRCVTRDEDEIADLIAETHSRAWIERVELLADVTPSRIMIRHAREACREWVATRRREVPMEESLSESKPLGGATPPAGAMTVEDAVLCQRWSDRVLSRLSEKQRLAVDYRCRWSWSYDAIAPAIDSAEATVRVHVYRGLRRLRTIVAGDPPPPLECQTDDAAIDSQRPARGM